MDVRFLCRFAVPAERAVREIDVDAESFIERLPNICDLLALRDGVRRDEGRVNFRAREILRGLEIPARDVIDFSGLLVRLARLVDVRREHVSFLLLRL